MLFGYCQRAYNIELKLIKLTMENSKALTFSLLESVVQLQEEIPHQHCNCYHCINNTKPLPYIPAPRITSPKQKKMSNSNAYELVLKQMVKGFTGKCQVPDVFFISEADIVYQSSSGRPKRKEQQTHIDVKKHFDEQRRKISGYGASQLLANSFVNYSQLQNLLPNTGRIQRQIAIMAYHDGTQQVLADTMLSKILEKRRNDPFWEGVSHIMLIPPEVKHPLAKTTHRYVRSNDTLKFLMPVMQKLARDVDNIQQKNLTGASKVQYKEQEDTLEIEFSLNPQSKLIRNMSMRSKGSFTESNFNAFNIMGDYNPSEYLMNLCIEIVAHIQVVSFTRILQADFQFYNEGGKYFLVNIQNFIVVPLENNELTLIHDRYKPFEEISLKEIAASKRKYDDIEAKQLWKICTAVVNQCLQFRKVELKLINYKKPNEQTLLKIFMKIFPDFKAEKIFASINWKNELDDFVAQTRNKINKTIREDEGIRILRRFGIEFRRTFH